MKAGDKVKIVNTKGLSRYSFYRKIKKDFVYTIRRVKPSGGIVLNELQIGYNIFGEEQGLTPDRFKKVKK